MSSDWTRECLDTCANTILGMCARGFLDEMNASILRLKKADCPGQWGWPHPSEGLNILKAETREKLPFLSGCLQAGTLTLSCLWTETQAGTSQMTPAHTETPAPPPQPLPSWMSSSRPSPTAFSVSHSLCVSCQQQQTPALSRNAPFVQSQKWQMRLLLWQEGLPQVRTAQIKRDVVHLCPFLSAWWQFNPVAKGRKGSWSSSLIPSKNSATLPGTTLQQHSIPFHWMERFNEKIDKLGGMLYFPTVKPDS